MKLFQKILFSALLLFFISGCATSNQKIEALENYIGKHIDDIVLSKGVATSTFEKTDGSIIYEWKKSYRIIPIGPNCSAERLVVDKNGIVNQYAVSILVC